MAVPFHSPMERRREELTRMADFAVKPTRIAGFDKTVGPGEVMFEVNFPVWFVERPAMSFSGELPENVAPVERKFPTVSVVVAKWKMVQAERPDGGFYGGAFLVVVTTGHAELEVLVHWQAEGKAMRNPAAGSGDTSGSI
jgi:hypothetical protein